MLGLVEPPSLGTYCSVLEVSARLLAKNRRKTTYPINKIETPASGKFTKYLKCSLLAICINFSKVLAARKKNLTTSRARKNKHTARKDHSIPLILSLPLADVDGFYNWSW